MKEPTAAAVVVPSASPMKLLHGRRGQWRGRAVPVARCVISQLVGGRSSGSISEPNEAPARAPWAVVGPRSARRA
jgi:hypothetical protein